jgi:hypothetical protein
LAASKGLAGPALAYVELLTQRIAKENNALFSMAECLLGVLGLTDRREDFERLDVERIGPGSSAYSGSAPCGKGQGW